MEAKELAASLSLETVTAVSCRVTFDALYLLTTVSDDAKCFKHS